MKKALATLFFCFQIATPAMLHAYIYEIKVLRGWNKNSKKPCFIIGCSDFHDKMHQSNSEQRSYLTNLFKSQNAAATKIILEDLSSPNVNGLYGHKQFWLNSNRGILASLTKDCKALGLDADNIEYRYCRVIALGGLLRQLNQSPYQSAPTCAIKVSSLVGEVQQMIKQISSYNDGQAMVHWYKESCAQVHRSMQSLYLSSYADTSCAAYFDKVARHGNRMLFLKRLLTFDSALLDCALVHTILSATGKKSTVIALAGGTHIDRAFEQLKLQGYTQVYATPVSFKRDYDVANALGSPIMPGGYCVKPEPIKLDVLKEYLK